MSEIARYIDADKIVFWIRHVSSNGMLCDTDVRKVAFSDEIARIPSADVAPRAEVAREILEEIMSEIQRRLLVVDGLSECSDEEEYYTGCSDAYGRIGGYILGLKEKYTEAEPPEGDVS